MPGLPVGNVTFLFTDIEGSTRLLQQLGERYAAVLEEHRLLMRTAFQEQGGQEIDTQGDAFFFAFSSAKQAVLAAINAQRRLFSHIWPEGISVRVRMGLHTGEATMSGSGYVGLDVHRAARICAVGHGGQILISQATYALIENDLPPGINVRDMGKHRLKDLAYPEHIFQLLCPDLPTDFPSLKSLDARPHNLPIQLTSFIGRERETKSVKMLMAQTRLLTLTGPGGCGKTRLALHVAADLLEEYPDGVWLVELATLSEPALIPQTVASVLKVREQAGCSLLSTLIDFLQPKQLLLVLDNCEHLVEACAQFIEVLLRTCPKLRILTTSRELLGITGEAAWRVPPLSLPDPNHLPTIESLTQYEAIRLFLERAAVVSPCFALTSQNAPAITQICQRLDGIPLAIELAAARVKVLSVEQIAARLDDRFRLLTGGSRTALRRQQTLQAAIDWSYELLSEKERILLRRLAVFAGGYTLEAAEAVCAQEGVDHYEVLDLLSQLVDKSLVVKEEKGGTARYWLLETIRQYSLEKLTEAREMTALRNRHLAFFVELTEQAEPQLKGADQKLWLERLEIEHDNLRAALEWSKTEISRVVEGLRLAGALWPFWEVRGFLSEGRRWIEGLLAVVGNAQASVRAKALRGAGVLASHQGDYERAATFLQESFTLLQQLGDKRGAALSLNNLGIVARNQGDYARATALYEEALALWRELGDQRGIAASLANLAIVARNQKDYSRATKLHEESLLLFRELGNKMGMAVTLNNLGVIAEDQGNYERAATLYKESLVLRNELGDKLGALGCLSNLAAVAGERGQLEWAARLFGAAEALREALSAPVSPDERAEYDSKVAIVRAKLDEATFTQAWAQGRAMTLEQAISYALEN